MVATIAGPRPANRAPSCARRGTLATAKSADTARSAPRPPPVCATIHAKTKCNGAPPRWLRTVPSMPSSESRPTKSASVSSSCGGQAVSRKARNAVTAAVHAATTGTNRRSADVSRTAVAAPSCATAPATTAAYPGSLRADADLRVPLPERPPVRGVPADGRPAAGGVRGLQRRAAGEGAPSRPDLLQGQGLLLDRLRQGPPQTRVDGRRQAED